MSKKVLIALPPSLLAKVDYAAQAECRTRSDLFREALRRYIDNFQRTQLLASNNAAVLALEETYSGPTTN